MILLRVLLVLLVRYCRDLLGYICIWVEGKECIMSMDRSDGSG